MLTAFRLQNRRLEQIQSGETDELSDDAVWVDIVEPTAETRARVMQVYGVHLPDSEDMEEIEATARFFKDDDGSLHVHSFFLDDYEDTPVNVTVACVVKDGRLFTIHEQELTTIRLFRLRARGQSGSLGDAMSILLSLFTTKVDRLADVLESVYTSLESASEQVLRHSGKDLHLLLADIANYEDISGKARLSLLDTQRALSFILRSMKLEGEQVEQIRDVLRDVESLLPHTAFLFDKVNFLMDAIQGFINIEQNKVVKIFSIAAVVFMPPTLVASIYGMNFRLMPELSWSFGYPLAIILMIISGISPYWYFKRRGWL
jgi:magnesium transporter